MTSRIPIGKVQVTLTLKGDGAVPELLPDAIGEITVGPHGFLNLLETQLGLPSADVSFTTRLIQYLGCIDQLENPRAFYLKSWAADPFSVARTLLQWRDQWYLAGWRGAFDEAVPARLEDMALIERSAATAVAPGLGQRVQRVIELLPHNPIAVGAITLRDELVDFPHLWQRLILALGAAGATVTAAAPGAAQGRANTDLHRLQQQLLAATNEKIQLRGDGSVIILRADSPQESTPITALLTRSWQAQAPTQSIALLAEARGELLDDALDTMHSPRLGFAALSPWRPVFQVLPLACELLWEPLNPTALFQFLSHPVGPLPARIRETLAQTVASTPGIGSAAWEDAIRRALENEDESKRERRLADIRYWLESPRFPPRTGVSSHVLEERAQRVANWLQGARESSDDDALRSLYNIALNQALEFVAAVERLRSHGRDPLTQDNVRRLIEDVRGTGAPVADRHAEMCPGQPRLLRADHAGAFYQSVDNVIWWDCQANDRVHRWPWSRTERAALAANGVQLQTEDEQLAWLGKAWLRPVLSARERCTIVLHADAERHHPVWDQISSLADGLPLLQMGSAGAIASLGIRQCPLAARKLPPRVRWWQLPASVTLPTRTAESFSSLDAWIHSPYQWLLRYAARIRPGSLGSVKDGNLLKGSLAHRLFEDFCNAHTNIGGIRAADITAWTEANIDRLLQTEGALLLEPGRQAECERFITQAQDALIVLVEHLQSAGVVRVQMELKQEGQYAGGDLTGSIDVLATRADGQEAVIDIKWGGKKYRREALLENSYLQLATYSQLRRNNGAALPPSLSYFFVADAHMLSLNHSFFPNAENLKPASDESPLLYWQRLENTWRWRKAQFDQGRVEVTVTGTEPDENSIPDEGGLDIPVSSDTYNDYAVLTGWGENA